MEELYMSIVNSRRASREFLRMYQDMPISDVADMYSISSTDVKNIIDKIIEKYSIRRKEGVA